MTGFRTTLSALLPLAAVILLAGVTAQETPAEDPSAPTGNEPVFKKTEPPLADVFPVEQTDEGVRLSKGILLNDGTVLPKGTVLRNFSAPVSLTDRSVRRYATQERMGDSFSRRSVVGGQDATLKPAERAQLQRIRETVWKEKDLFLAAADYFKKQDLNLVFVDPASGEIEFTPFTSFRGLFLAEDNGAITVLSVDPESQAANQGFRPGDVVLSINDQATKGSLDTFVKLYEKSRIEAGTSRADIRIEVQRGTDRTLLQMKAPVSLNSSFF